MEEINMKTVILTGASSGIGLSTGLRLAKEGYEVHGIGRCFDECLSYPESFHRYTCDITDSTELGKTLQNIKTGLGSPAPDILIHSAGIGLYGLQETLSPSDLQSLIRTNLEAPILITTEFLSYMKQRKSGHIFFISSITAKKTNTYGCAYGATKAGLLSFANSLFDETRKNNIKITTLLPDMTKTNLYRNADFTADDTACLFPEDIADTISYVLSCGDHLNITELTIQPQKHRIQKK
jgi:NADP-dependent 3-hydroxy acid dehydrogenase YdfG